MLGDGPLHSSDIEDRLVNIRKATNLDFKSLYFLPAETSVDEAAEFTKSLLTSLHPLCIDYYRDLSKHARRKRNRNTIPQPTIPPSDGHPLPSHGWNTRYEFKLGVFAEFRQEMDAARRNYESAYESLFAPEMIDAIAVWSPRFNEARLLSDVIAVRILRCLLWTGQITSAVRTWTSHRDRAQDLVNRRGKGTENYGWEAWQSTWSKTMADLLSRSDLPGLNIKTSQLPEITSIFAGPEKSLSVGERMIPWENLQHQGYWLEIAQNHTQRRRTLAQQLPVEDRQPPNSAVASKAQAYDTYMTPEPHAEFPADGTAGFDYVGEILLTLEAAEVYYAERGQLRMLNIVELKKGLEHLRAEAWSEAALVLQPLWKSQLWRQAGWWKLLQHIGWALLDCAVKLQEAELIIRLKWELANKVFAAKPDTDFNIHTALDGLPLGENRLVVALDVQEAAARIISSFAFVSAEGHVGEPLDCQFVLHSPAHPGSPLLILTEVKIVFEGALKPIYLGAGNADGGVDEIDVVSLTLEESSRISNASNKRSSAGAIASLSGTGNLAIAAGQTRIFNMQAIPREAGEVSVASITLMLEEERFSLTMTISDLERTYNQWWESKSGSPVRRDIGPSRDVSRIQILPKPPKVEIQAKNFNQAYYTNEHIQLDLDISNNEEETVIASIEARLISPVKDAARIQWLDADRSDTEDAEDLMQTLPPKDLATIHPSSSGTTSLVIFDTAAAVDHELEVGVTYSLASDRETILRKVLTLDIAVIRPFEANYDFTPKLNSDPWPNFFSPPTPTDPSQPPIPQGLIQTFLVTANLVSFATDPIVIEGILLTSTRITGGAVCSSTTGVVKQDNQSKAPRDAEIISTSISHNQVRAFDFSLSVHKLKLGDRHPVSLDLALEIGWRRPNSDKIHTTILEVPRFVMPMSEPRVLLTAEKRCSIGLEGMQMDVHLLRYVVENPSMHFLTFNLSMESSEQFAFSGPKACAVSLVPISKQEVVYRILPRMAGGGGGGTMGKGNGNGNGNGNEQGQWVKVQLNVVDAYFNQTLRVQPALEDGKGERVKVDKKGGVVVLID